MSSSKEEKTKRKKHVSEKKVPNLFSRLFYFWMCPMFYNGTRRDLDEDDLVPGRDIYIAKTIGDKLERKWLEEVAAAKTERRDPSFRRALIKAFFWSYMPGGLMIFAFTAIRTFTPLLFGELLRYWSVDSDMTRESAVIFAVCMLLANWVAAFFVHQGNLYCQQFGMKVRTATSSLMFRKVMRMDNGSLGETTTGKVVNILANDLLRYDLALMFLHYIWIIPIQVVAVAVLGYMQAGYAALVGLLALMAIALPFQAGIGRFIGKVRFRTTLKTDERIKIMNEVINGIQVIKMYAWEMPFEKLVGQKRVDELNEVRTATYLRTVMLGFMLFIERTALFLVILTFILTGNSLTANVIYPLQQIIASAQLNVTLIFPLILAFTAELLVSLKRVEDFLILKERPDLQITFQGNQRIFNNSMNNEFRKDSLETLSYMKSDSPKLTVKNVMKYRRSLSVPGTGDIAVELRDVSASWVGDTNKLALKNISLRLRKGKLCAVIGSVGCGKSSFLQLLLKELSPVSGSVSVNGTLSYGAQESWLFPTTVRENILFGLPYHMDKYKRVCKVCALEKDFKQFPFSDQTLVGERGVSLSGGQRARINLARAVYREADIYLLDDPLSAVDSNVGRQLFEGCINGYLRDKTRILVTHQIHFIKSADYIVVLNEGSVENMGTFDELVSTGKDLAKLLVSLNEEKDSQSIASERLEKPVILRSTSVISETEKEEEFEAQTLNPEERQSGNIKVEVITSYLTAGGSYMLVFLALFMILIAAASAASIDYWISYWTNQMAAYEEGLGGDAELDVGMHDQVGLFTTAQYLIIHSSLIIVCILLANLRVIPYVAMCVSASQNLHNRMFSTMLRGIMRFFDTSSSGRILNRFTKDMGALDEILPRSLMDVLQIYSTLLCILVLNAIALYWTLVPTAVLLILFFFIVRIYLKTAQAVKRVEGTTKSPVFGMVSSSLNGIATIRAAGAQERLIQEFDKNQDMNTWAWNAFLAGGSTFGFYLDTLCIVYLATVIFVFLFLDLDGIIAVGSVGLAVTQSNMLTTMLQHGARMLVEFLAQLTSVERVLEYTKIETETNLFDGKIPTPEKWPSKGKITFNNMSLRYSPDDKPVLKNINLEIESGWKVGIVGRTGAGKSSLISAMFRFSYTDGNIVIDGIDTSLIARQDLRTRISIIPQEPVLFSSTIRYNLDPFGLYSDDELWRALEQVELKSSIPSLDFKVTEGGANFSVGQRQLMCLARAVLRSNKILIMDEATANVDPQTDSFIQKTIRSRFGSCTVLTIAHRLNTIMDSDRVLVMDSGCVAEFDHPYTLLSDPNSHLSSMVKETGEKMSAQLLEMARESFFQSNLKDAAR